jgi:hypothetical protein
MQLTIRIYTIIECLDIIHHSVFLFKKQRFGEWTLFPSSGKSLLRWAQSIELVHISGYQNQRKTEYINYRL